MAAFLAAATCLCANPGATIPLPQALDNTLTWRTGGELPWFGCALVSHDGTDAARSGGAGAGVSWLETDVTGPGVLTFWAKTDISFACVTVSGDERRLVDPAVWTQHRLRIRPGLQTVQWRGEFNAATTGGAAALFLDEVNFTPSAAVSLGEAADAPELTWSGSEGAFGFSENGEGVTGGDFIVLQGGGSVTAEVAGPAALRFRWKMTGYGVGAGFSASVGGATQLWQVPADPADGSRGAETWFDAEVLVPAGSQNVVWTPAPGGDFLLDGVTVTAAPPPGTAVGQPGLTWSGDWLTRSASAAIGGGVAVTRLLAPEQESVLSTTITGPAEVSFVSSLLRAEAGSPLAPAGAVPVRVDGVEGTARSVPLADGWQRTTVFVPEGAHRVEWVVANPPAPPFGWPHYILQGVLDDIQITAAAPETLALALKTTLAPQVTEGEALPGRWRGMKSLTSGINGSAVVCGPLGEGEATTLTLPVTGPARLMLSLRGERWTRDRIMAFTAQIDGAEVQPPVHPLALYYEGESARPADWHTQIVAIPSGAHTLTLRASEAAPGALLWLDALGYLPADPGVSKIAAAVEMPGTQWRRTSPPGRGAWRVLASPMAREGRMIAACMDVAAGQSASLETTITGPGVLEFTWAQAAAGTLEVSVNDTKTLEALSPLLHPVPPSARMELLLPPGPQTVRWTFTREGPSSSSAAQAWLDAVKFTMLAAGNSPAPGLDVTVPVTTDTDWQWRTAAPSFSATGDGDAAMVEVPEAGAAFLELPLTGPGRFAFWWRAEAPYLSSQSVALSVDGQENAWLPAAGNWYRSEIAVSPGAHVLRWQVKATGSSLRREDVRRVWLDGFAALPALPLAAALDNTLTWTTGHPSDASDFTEWIGLPASEAAANPGTDDAAVTLGTRPLTTTVTGPGVVTFRWAEKSVPPLPSVAAPPAPPSPGSPAVIGGGYYGAVFEIIGGWNWNWWQPPPPRAVFAVNGTSRATLDLSEGGFDSAWATHTIHLGPGEHTLTWQRPARSNGRRLVVESVSFTPQPDLYTPAAAELGVPAAGLTFNGAPWTVQNTETHDGTAALQSPGGGGSSIELEFTGPGELSFWWKATGSADFRDITNGEFIAVFGNLGYPVAAYTAPMEWRRFTWNVSAGPHRFSWRAMVNATMWLDELTFAAPQPLAGANAVAEALDFTSLTWNAPGWQPMTGPGLSDTGDALVGPELSEGVAPPWLETTITGPATMRFTWKMETFPGNGPGGSAAVALEYLLDGVAQTLPSGSADTGTPLIPIPAGVHTLRFVFQSSAPQSRRPVVDDVRLEFPVAAALDAAGFTWTGSFEMTHWRGWRSDRYAGRETWVESAGVNQGRDLTTSFTNSKLISCDVRPLSTGAGETASDLVVELDSREVWRSSGDVTDWQTIRLAAGPGSHTIRFFTTTPRPWLLDRFTVTPDPVPQPSLAEALETPGRDYFGSAPSVPSTWTPVRNPGSASHDDAAFVWFNPTISSVLNTVVDGPAWVTFDYRTAHEGAVLDVMLDGSRASRLGASAGWESARPLFVPPGAHIVGWSAYNTRYQPGQQGPVTFWPIGSVHLDAISITPLYSASGAVPLAEALDAPGLTFTNGGQALWDGHLITDAAGGDAAVVVATSADAELNTTVTGPGTLVWRWKAERFGSWTGFNPSLHLLVDGLFKVTQSQTSPIDWITAEWPVPPGEHSVRWLLRSQALNSIGWLDDVRFIPAPTLAEALDLPAGVVVNVEAGAPAPVTLRDGSDAVFLDPVAGNGPILSATVTGPGELAFDWKNSLQSDSFSRMVTVDGRPAGDWYPSLTQSLENVTARAFIAVGPGEHVIRWQANFPNSGDGAGVWLDRVTWRSGLPAWAQAAGGIGANGVTAWITGGAESWSSAAGTGMNNSAAATASGGWLTAIVPPGPGTLCWWGRTASADGSNTGAGLTGPGASAFFSSEWRFMRASRGAGQPLPVWRTGTAAFVTGANFTPFATVPLPQALDAPEVVFETSPDAPWSGLAATGAPLGASAAKAGWSEDTVEGSWLRTTFRGPGRLNFSFRTAALSGYARAIVSVDNQETSLTSIPQGTWQPHSLWLESGERTVTWSLREVKDGDEFWLDSISYSPAQPVPLATALGYSGAPWTTGGAAAWTGVTPLPSAADSSAAISPPLLENEEAWMETTVPGSGVLTWKWEKASTPAEGDFTVLLDGLPLTHLPDSGGAWQTHRWELPAGSHTIRWRFAAARAGAGQATLDEVTFTPGPAPDWSATLGAQTVPIGAGGTVPWATVTEDDGPLLRNQPESWEGLGNAVFADITGPAQVTYQVRSYRHYLSLDNARHEHYEHDEWKEIEFLVPPGRHRLRWMLNDSYRLDLRAIHVTPLPAVSPLADAVEASGLTMVPASAAEWFGVRENRRPDDVDYATVQIPPFSERTLEVEFTGPGILHAAWDWQGSDQGAAGEFRLEEGTAILQSGRVYYQYIVDQNTADWNVSRQFGPGTHRVRFVVKAEEYFFAPRLYHLRFDRWLAVSVADGFGTPSRSFTTGGEGTWAGYLPADIEPVAPGVVWAQAAAGGKIWLETEIAGPAEILFGWRVSAPVGCSLTFYVNGAVTSSLSGTPQVGERQEKLRLLSGTHRVRWEWQRSLLEDDPALLNAGWLKELAIIPLIQVSISEAADVPALTFTPQSGDWLGWRSIEAVTGGDLIEVSRTDGTIARLDVSLTGPGILRWAWNKAHPGWPMPMSAVLQNRQMAEYTDYGGWKAGFIAVPPGAQTVTFAFGQTGGPSGVLGQLDNFTWQPTSDALTVAEAVEASGLTNISPVTPGDWFPLQSNTLNGDGTDALVAGVPGGPEHRLRANATGPGTLSYVTNAHQPGVGSNLASVGLFVDGIRSTSVALQYATRGQRVLHFTGGSPAHTFEWRQDFAAFYRTEYDYAWLDELTFTPAEPVPLAAALDQPGWTFRTGGTVPWQGGTSAAGVNGSLAFSLMSAAAPNAPESWVETDLNGPGVLYFDWRTPPGTQRLYVDGTLQYSAESANLTAGPHTLRWSVGQPTPSVEATVTLDNLEWFPATWAGWQAHQFPAGTPAAVSDLTADPDNDGRPNGIEAWLGTSPLRADTAPPLSIASTTYSRPRLTFDTAVAPPEGIMLTIEEAATPAGPWSAVCESTASGLWRGLCYFEQSYLRARERRYFFAGSEAARFFRMRVTR